MALHRGKLRTQLLAGIVALAGCGGSDVGISGGDASASGTGDTSTGTETVSASGATLTGAEGTGESGGSETAGPGGSGTESDSLGTGDTGETGSSTGPDVVCGDDQVGGAEVCDGSDLGDEDCTTQGFDGGTLACLDDCSAFDTTECFTFMGDCCANNGTPGCDDAACTAAICADDPACCDNAWDGPCASAAFDHPACIDAGGSCPACGDAMAQGAEVCDGADLDAQDCTTVGFDIGTLGCLGDCSDFDTSNCVDFAGDCCADNGTPGCDDAGCTASICAADATCCTMGWDAACAAAAVDDPACQNVGGSCPDCGDDVIEGLEVCDGTNVSGQVCTDLGFDGGTLQCATDCSGLDTSTCQYVGFGDCVNNPPATACLATEQCITDLGMPPAVGVCTDVECMVAADCPLSPPGGTAPVACIDVTGEGINECVLSCVLGQTCPTGMQCELGLACAWPAN
jgi:hypothetical protein